MSEKWSSRLDFFLKEPWVVREEMSPAWASQVKGNWLDLKRGIVLADGDRLFFAFSVIEEMKETNQYLRVLIMVPNTALQHQWFEELHKAFDFPEGLVGLMDDKHQDFFSKKVRILICTASQIDLLTSKIDSFLGQDLLLIIDEVASYEAIRLRSLFTIPRAYSLGLMTQLLQDYYRSLVTKELGPIIYSELQDLLDCSSLQGSDEYFEALLSEDMLIGDIPVTDEELKHLTKLISVELKATVPDIDGSISVAVFLVWMGILHYQEGSYWAPVYDALELPQDQIKWQSFLGNSFLSVIRQYNLLSIEEKLKYTTPILAHGYVPDYYLHSYFEDCVLALYMELEKSNLAINKLEVAQLVSNWRKDYKGYQAVRAELEQVEKKEKQLVLFQQTLLYAEDLNRYQHLEEARKDSVELDYLLDRPDDWLSKAETEKQKLQSIYDEHYGLLKQKQSLAEARDSLTEKREELERHADEVAQCFITNWKHSYRDSFPATPLAQIQGSVQDYNANLATFSGFLGKIFRILQPKHYRRFLAAGQCLKEVLLPLNISPEVSATTNWPDKLLSMIKELDSLLAQRREIVQAIQEQEQAIKEIAADSMGLADNDEDVKERLDALSQEITAYKMNIVKLGRGKYEHGAEELAQQQVIHRDMSAIQSAFKGDLPAMLSCLSNVIDYDEKELHDNLVRARKQIKACNAKLKIYINPLYTLIEAPRALFFQGGDKATTFLWNSLLLLEFLVKGNDVGGLEISPRISQAMLEWWEAVGRAKSQKYQTDGVIDRPRERGTIKWRKPHIYLDIVDREVKLQLPSQMIGRGKAQLAIHGDQKGKKHIVPMQRVEGGYKTEPFECTLEAPESIYNIEFTCGDASQEWLIHGPGRDNFSMLFNSNKQLVEGNRLPDLDAWIVAPANFRIEPAESIREQFNLQGGWSDFVCTNIDLDEVDVVLVWEGRNVDIFRRQTKLAPVLVGGDSVSGAKTREGAPIYRRELPGLVFSVKDAEDLRNYGLRFGGDSYMPVSELNPVVNKDNSVFINLKDTLKEKYGDIKLTLTLRATKIIWSGGCSIVPDLNIKFSKELYSPVTGSPEFGRVEIRSSTPFTLTIDLPSKVLRSTPNEAWVEFDSTSALLTGDLEYSLEDSKGTVGLQIDIPCIRWHLDGQEWKAETEELWHEDIGIIEVMLPSSFNGPGSLALGDGTQRIERQFKHGIASFDLRKFADSIREDSNPTQDVTLSLPSESFAPVLLLNIRTVWQVAKVGFTEKEVGDMREIHITWEDWGRAKDRIIRLWPLEDNGTAVVQYPVPDGMTEITITESVDKLPVGQYRLQFDIDDPWAAETTTLPEKGTLNCKDVGIGSGQHGVLTMEDRLDITCFESAGKLYNVKSEYWIEDIGLAQEFEGEKRYKGKIFSTVKGNPVELECNPVSFYFEGNALPFLVDYQEDGAMYCLLCGHFFWEVLHGCEKKFHIEPETIFVRRR